MQDYFSLSMTTRDVNQISALGLAHCGDAVFELMVRSWLCLSGRARVENLHRATVSYVCAPAQAARADRMLPLLSEEIWRGLTGGESGGAMRTSARSRKTRRTSSMPRPRASSACSARSI